MAQSKRPCETGIHRSTNHLVNHSEHRAQGVKARKETPRGSHGHFNPRANPTPALELLRYAEVGRVPQLLPVRHERMAASSFAFFRGAVAVMAADLASHSNTGIQVQICGDAHVLNLGSYASFDGRLVFDINDFDETIRGPFEWDLKRMATSLLLAGRTRGIGHSIRESAVARFVSSYRNSIHKFATMPMLQLARYQIHRLEDRSPIRAILKAAERSTPIRLLEKLTESNHGQRRFKSKPPLLERAPQSQVDKLLRALTDYEDRLQPERKHFLGQYRLIDAAFKVVGTGSIGLRNYCLYFEGVAREPGTDPLFLQLKEEPASAYAPYLPDAASCHTNQAHRVVDGQRAMQLTSDPLLGYTQIEEAHYLVRQLNDHKAALDVSQLSGGQLISYADICGELLARGHARSGESAEIAGYLGASGRFDVAILRFARSYADKMESDWREFKASLSHGRRAG
jgi:uncharacterized protein (DUF2252 family)